MSLQSQGIGKTDINLTLQRQLSDLREKKVKSEVEREEVDTELMTATSVAQTMEDIHTELNGISESLSQPQPPALPEAVQQECLSPSQSKAPAILQQVPTHSQSDCTDTYSVGRKESENGAEDENAKLHTREKITQHWSFPLKTGAKHTQSGCVLESQATSKSARPTLRPVNVVVQKHSIETREEEEAKQPVARKLPTELYDCTPYYPPPQPVEEVPQPPPPSTRKSQPHHCRAPIRKVTKMLLSKACTIGNWYKHKLWKHQ